ncbi:MAG: Cadherin proteinputative collagen-binding protein [Verrucomicrobiales bacterium]|nr:Cadherin proteinputative collagen-binding protein [Verrucomicrobiales bacterium]
MKFPPSSLLLPALTAVLFTLPPYTRAGQTDIKAPEESGEFGSTVTILPNGNIVVTDPFLYAPGFMYDVGAVYLYSPAGVLISTLTGSHRGDHVGMGGVKVLANGNYVVLSHLWNRGTGAVTWGNRDTGVSGVVSAENSLTGAGFGDMEAGGSAGVTALSNGNYVVSARYWSNGGNAGAGAVTWGNGAVGTAGVISSANSLVGSIINDQVGTVTGLKNGDYVVTCPQWSNGGARNAGAVVWCDGGTGRRGPVSTENALFGTAAQSRVGGGDLSLGGPVVELANGNFVVVSPQWSDGTVPGAGAVTWCPAGGGLIGPVSGANSLIGSSPGDLAGGGGMDTGTTARPKGDVIPLSDGNYAVASPLWDKPGAENSGAVMWCDGSAGMAGRISAAGSLTGATAGDCIGGGGMAALANGHYAVCSPLWNRTSEFGSGAVTHVIGGGPLSGTVSAENSLVGTGPESYLTVLANGNYVVCSPQWHNRPAAFRAGAVTWCDGGAGLIDVVSAANSLVGTSLDDHVGADTMEGSRRHPGVVALGNGNYVVRSVLWDKGDIPDAGAVTWCGGTRGRTGPVGAANSLTGSTAEDRIGEVTALSDGNYVAGSPYWDAGGAADAGAVAWCDGTAGRTGEISTANSIAGSKKDDLVGRDGVEALNGGYYVFSSRYWKGTGAKDSGAVTLGKSGGGTAGLIDLTNSILGTGFPYVAAPYYGASFSGNLIAAGRPRSNSVGVFSYTAQSGPAPFGENGGEPQAERLADGRMRITFKALPGAEYLLQRSTDLEAWTPGLPFTAGPDGTILWLDEAPSPGRAYYRLKAP